MLIKEQDGESMVRNNTPKLWHPCNWGLWACLQTNLRDLSFCKTLSVMWLQNPYTRALYIPATKPTKQMSDGKHLDILMAL